MHFVLFNFPVDISMVISYNMLQYIGEKEYTDYYGLTPTVTSLTKF